jgi:hypothetical protein
MKNFGNALVVSVGLIGLFAYGCSDDSDDGGGTGGTMSSGGKGGSSGKGGSGGKGGSAGKPSATGGTTNGGEGGNGDSGSSSSGQPGTGGSQAGGGGQPEAGGGGQGGDGAGMPIVLTNGMTWTVCDTSSATTCGTWVWTAATEQFATTFENGAVGTATVEENGSQIRLHRVDTAGPAPGLEGDYVGEYHGGDTVSGMATWTWDTGSAAGTWTATW